MRGADTMLTTRARPLGLGVLLVCLAAIPALAAAGGQSGPSEVVFIAQIMALMVVGRLLGEAMINIGQPAVMGQLIAGLLLGPSLFGLLLPDLQQALFPKTPEQKAMISAISEFGILLLLLLTGMETDLKLVRQTGRASVYASLMGIVVPFGCGVALGEMLPDSMLPSPDKRLITSLFLGTALSIASVKIVAMVVREMNFMRRVVGQVIIASAIIDDSVGWIIVSVIFSLALHGSIEPAALAQSIIGTIAFMAFSFTVGRRAVFFAIRWANDNFASEFAVITTILVIMGAMALTTHLIGVHSVLGAFVAGILVGESPILSKHIDEQLRGLITAFFAPVFFGIAGLSADLTILADPQMALLTVGLILIASIGKFGGAFIGAELGGLTKREGFALACGMNARGSTEVIIATVGLSMGALTQNLFTMIVAMAVITTMAMPPTLRWALSRIPMRKDEKQRLEREEMEAKGFVPNLERLLLAVDESNNGKFASRIAGLIAGSSGMPTTVMHIKTDNKRSKAAAAAAKERAVEAGKTVKEFAGQAGQVLEADANPEANGKKPAGPKKDSKKEDKAKRAAAAKKAEAVKKGEAQDEKAEAEEKPDSSGPTLEVSTMVEKPKSEAVAEEAKKGYDLLIIGLDKMTGRKGVFHDNVANIAAGFEGALAVVDARGEHRKQPLPGAISILVPVNGTEVSRRAAEVAVIMARASKAPLTALYVSPGKRIARQYEEAILKDVVALGESYDVSLRTAVQADTAPDVAILRETGKRKHNIVVMGVGRRPGDKLFFGDTAAALLANSEHSLVFVAS
jgi:Kef-type K+ transport system membrane component KefB/nucleotide-binding universal stress UspA family protein